MGELLHQEGSFNVSSNAIVLSDPCHEINAPVNFVCPAKNGRWDIDSIGMVYLRCYLQGCDFSKYQRRFLGYVCVDSGTISCFDKRYYNPDNYDSMIEKTWTGLVIVPGGCLIPTGTGDGPYEVYFYANENHEVVGIEYDLDFTEEQILNDETW